MLELPLHIMDTALFYPSYMNLANDQARGAVLPLIENVTRFGGVLTINWHDRSLGPERLWGDAYLALLGDLRARTPWFATGFANRLMVSSSTRGIVRQCCTGWRNHPGAASYQLDCR